MGIRSLIVDLDGTVWDSLPLYASILADSEGADLELYLNRLRAGANVVALIRESPELNPSAFAQELRFRHDELLIYEGVRETLIELDRKAIPVGVATSLAPWICDPLLEETGLIELCGTVINASHARKPSAAVVHMTARALRITTDGMWFAGDTQQDARTAKLGGVLFAWASYGYAESPPDESAVTLESFEEILQL